MLNIILHTMKYLLHTLLFTLLLAMQGCAVGIHSEPLKGSMLVTEPANDTPQFRIDHQVCMAEVEKMWPNASQENVAVIQYRRCLLNKGYRLLS